MKARSRNSDGPFNQEVTMNYLAVIDIQYFTKTNQHSYSLYFTRNLTGNESG